MKRFITMLIILATLAPIGARAASPSLGKDGKTIIFNPEITSVETMSSSMAVNIDTTTVAFMYVVQWSDTEDFRNARTMFFRNLSNKGCMMSKISTIYRAGKTIDQRAIWYGGQKIDWRAVERKGTKLGTPQTVIKQIENRYRVQRRLYVPGKGRYVRVRCIYYGTTGYEYSRWSTWKAR